MRCRSSERRGRGNRSPGATDTTVREIIVNGGKAVADTALRTWGRVDVLVNNAGTVHDSPFEEMTDDVRDRFGEIRDEPDDTVPSGPADEMAE